jgi:hypothetical protein
MLTFVHICCLLVKNTLKSLWAMGPPVKSVNRENSVEFGYSWQTASNEIR